MKKIGFISGANPLDRKASSGTNFQFYAALQRMGYALVWIPVKGNFLYKCMHNLFRVYGKIFRRKIKIEYTKIGAYLESRSLDYEKMRDCDCLIGSFCSGALSRIKTEKPIIYLTDATFHIMDGYYFENLHKACKKSGEENELRALENSNAIVYSSNWALNSAINDYKIDRSKLHFIVFGANIDAKDVPIIQATVNDKHPHQWDFLFLGVDWIRKGGQIAVDTIDWLNKNNINARLHIVGIKPETLRNVSNPNLVFHGFYNKNIPEEYKKLTDLMKNSDALLLPTLRECSAIAFCEASAFGLPIFTHKTGGIGDYVIPGKNGYALEIGSTGVDFGKLIQDCIQTGALGSMKKKAQSLYLQKYNWDSWGKQMDALIKQLIPND